jgi:hypothetical protein
MIHDVTNPFLIFWNLYRIMLIAEPCIQPDCSVLVTDLLELSSNMHIFVASGFNLE